MKIGTDTDQVGKLLRRVCPIFRRSEGCPLHMAFSLEETKLTRFQRRVLKVVSQIPAGETRTYKWVAGKVKSPDAARAVGQALRKNPYPLLIPCHRVISSDGSPGGFSRGVKVKEQLLKLEKRILERSEK